MTKTAAVSLHGNTYEVDPALAGRRIELHFDPYGLDAVEVYDHGCPFGTAVPHSIGRHVHPQARTEATESVARTGIDYLDLIAQDHERQLARRINYHQLAADQHDHEENP